MIPAGDVRFGVLDHSVGVTCSEPSSFPTAYLSVLVLISFALIDLYLYSFCCHMTSPFLAVQLISYHDTPLLAGELCICPHSDMKSMGASPALEYPL